MIPNIMAAEQTKQVSPSSYRFPPTVSVDTNYSQIVPDRSRRGARVRELERALERTEEEEGEMKIVAQSFSIMTIVYSL